MAWVLAALFGVSGAHTFINADDLAERSGAFRSALISVAEKVDAYIEDHGALPSDSTLERMSASLEPPVISWFVLASERPSEKEGFDFPPWTEGEHYALGYWRVDWMEFYDSASGQTTLDRGVDPTTWKKHAIGLLGITVALAVVGYVLLRFSSKGLTNRLRQGPQVALSEL